MNLEDMLGGKKVDEGVSVEDMLGARKAPASLIEEKAKPIKTELSSAYKIPELSDNLFTTQLKSLRPSVAEVDPCDLDPFVTEEMKQGFMETVRGLEDLRSQPLEIARGIVDFAASIPGFLSGVAVAVQRMSDAALKQIVLRGDLNLEELYDVASGGMQETMEFFEPGKKLIAGEPTPQSRLVGELAMAPVTAISKMGHEVSEWPRFKDYPNIRGAARFIGDIAGFVALGMLSKGPKGDIANGMERVVRKANDIKSKEVAIEGVPESIAKKVQERIIEVEKKQLELEAEVEKKKLEKELDLDKPIKDDLKKKGKKVKEKEIEDAKIEEAKEAEAERVTLEDMVEERVIEEPSMEFKVGGGNPPVKGLAVANIGSDGKIYYGEIGELHYDLYTKYPDVEWIEEGFADSSGKYLSRRAAIKEMDVPITEEFKEFTDKGELEAVAYLAAKAKQEALKVVEVDKQLDPKPKPTESEQSPFFQNAEESAAFGKLYDERAKSVAEDVEVFTQKTINDINRWYHGDETIDIGKTRDVLRKFATRADELRMEFLNPEDFRLWKETVSDASEWASNLRLMDERSGVELYSGIPIHKFPEATRKIFSAIISAARKVESGEGALVSIRELRKKFPKSSKENFDKAIIGLADSGQVFLHKHVGTAEEIAKLSDVLVKDKEGNYYTGLVVRKGTGTKLYSGVPLDEVAKTAIEGAKRFKGYVDRARGMRKVKPSYAIKALKEELRRNFVDRSGNIRLELLDKLGDEGYDIIQRMYLRKGSNALAANMLKQMQKEVYGGLSKVEKEVLDKVILAERMVDIGKYKTPKEFKFPEGLSPSESATYSELFPYIEKISTDRVGVIRNKVQAYYEWMKKPLKDMLDAELISQKEHDALVAHNYRKIKLVDIFDKRYTAKIKKKPITVYDSGVEALAKGRKTDVYEPSSEIMALEVFNRAYGRILNNEANKSLFDLAHSDSKNPFVRVRKKGESIPQGWQRVFVYKGGERKAMYLSPNMSKEWIVSSSDMPYRYGQFLRFVSGSPVLRTFATGINWGFALANLPRDIMHVFFAARIYDGKEWKSVYSNQLPIYIPQIGMDLARTFTDAATRGKRYQKYVEEGGGMEFLVHQGRIFARGRRLETPLDKVQNFMGYFGETTEIMTRLAIRERVIRRKAKERNISIEEARKNKDITREATFAARDFMDFGQGGGITKAADNALPYLSASVQGTRGLWRTAADNPKLFGYKVAQVGAATVLVRAAMREQAPLTAKALEGSTDIENNLCLPLGDGFSFEDNKGQTRYIYFKVPLDPGQKFFKIFFDGAYDKYAGHEVDIDRITSAMKDTSPVGISNLPPTLSGGIGYLYNKDLWLNKDIWKKTDKPFGWPKSKEEYIPGKTPEAFIGLGEVTGLSPERSKFAVEELTTSGTLWSYLLGKGYDELFADVPKEQREQHLAMVLSRTPIAKRFLGVTNPYSKYAGEIERREEDVSLDHWKQRRELDRLTEGYLFENSVDRGEVFKYIRSFRDKRVRERLHNRFNFQWATRNLGERSFWLRLQHLDPEVRASVYHKEFVGASKKRRSEMVRERAIIGAGGGFFSKTFDEELAKLMRKRNKTD